MPEILTDLSHDEYLADLSISKSKLDLFARDANSLEWAEHCPVDSDKLKTLDFGKAMHAICLEPDKLKTKFTVLPDLNLRTNAGKAEKAEFLEANQEKTILTYDDHKKLNLMFESVMAHPMARNLIEAEGSAEISCFWTDEKTGITCKCRPDKDIANSDIIVDIKTTDMLSKFRYSVEDYRYYVQAPYYTDGMTVCGQQKNEMLFIVIQKTIELGRYPVAVMSLPPEIVQYGCETYRKNLDDYAEFLAAADVSRPVEIEMHPGFYGRMDNKTVQEII